MSKFREDQRVVVIGENNEILKGTIKTVYDEIKTAIVEMDNGSFAKFRFSDLGIMEKDGRVQDTPENNETDETSDDGLRIRITSEEFEERLERIMDPDFVLGDVVDKIDPLSFMMKSAVVLIVGMEIKDKLFGENKVIEITEDELIDVITRETTPEKMVESVDGKMTKKQCLPVALLSNLLLTKVVKTFFDESDDD